jgi:hypothetical protein
MQSSVITEKLIFPVDDSNNDETRGHKTKDANKLLKNKLDKFWKTNINTTSKGQFMSQTISADAHRTIDVHSMTQTNTSQQKSTIVTDKQQLRKCKSLGNMQQEDRVNSKKSKSNCDFRYLSLNNRTEAITGVENRDDLLHDQDTSSSIVSDFDSYGNATHQQVIFLLFPISLDLAVLYFGVSRRFSSSKHLWTSQVLKVNIQRAIPMMKINQSVSNQEQIYLF